MKDDVLRGLREVARDFGIEREQTVGVAVSGGSDSLAMLSLLHEAGWSLEAATVDHGLRPEAAEEAAYVARVCAELGVPHATLTVDLSDTGGNLQDRARRGRYGALQAWAAERGIRYVALGHTLDDQAETFLMRLARGSGLDGLTGLGARLEMVGAVFLRPFRSFRRDDLKDYLRLRQVTWIDDPSNEDERFDRVKARRILKSLDPLGVTVDGLAMTMRNLASARRALQDLARDIALEAFREEGGDLVFDRQRVEGTSEETLRRLLVGAVMYLSGNDYPPRRQTVTELQEALRNECKMTVGGCIFSHEDEATRVTREFNAVKNLSCPTDQPWDGRWCLEGPHDDALEIRALGEAVKHAPWRETGLPRQSLLASPAVWRAETLIAAPVAGLPEGWTAKATGRGKFADFLISR